MKVVFLDRDGVINEFPGNGNYVTKVKNFYFLPRALEALRLLTETGYIIFVISNQAGVAKGLYTKNKLYCITRYMMKEVRSAGAKIKRVFYCTHRSDHGCDCRKPEIGSIVRALESMNKTIHSAKKAYLVGDTEVDIKAGHNAGCKTIFVLSGREDQSYIKKWEVRPDFIAKDLFEAAQIIVQETPNSVSISGQRLSLKRSVSRRSLKRRS